MENKKRNMTAFIIGILFFLWGGIYDFSMAVYGMIFSLALVGIMQNTKKIVIPVNVTTCGLGIILLGYVFSIFSARDKGIAFLGIIRILTLVVFLILWNTLEWKMRELIWELIPKLAVLVTVIAIAAYPFLQLRKLFFRAGRLGGVFQYSNTYALFLLLAVIILFYREEKRKREYVEIALLLGGIVFCGSRSVMIITMVVMAIWIIKSKERRKPLILVICIVLALVVSVQMFADLNLGRLLKLTLTSSTLNGRFLYWKDAIPVILKNPLGLGYMGYYFRQPQFQTGVYGTKFVHNDILQCGLDAGIIPMIALLSILFVNILNRKNAERNRMLLSVLLVHCVFDFDLQFGAMMCLMLMCLNDSTEKKIEIKAKWKEWVAMVLTITYGYFAVALGLAYFGKNEEALRLYPFNTFAREQIMEENIAEAEKLIEQNGMLAQAFEFAAEEHICKNEYQEAYKDIEGMIKCAGYDMYYYNKAAYDLSFCLQQALENEDKKMIKECIETIRNIPEEIQQLEERTSALAYRINDKPTFELDREIQEYIDNISRVQI